MLINNRNPRLHRLFISRLLFFGFTLQLTIPVAKAQNNRFPVDQWHYIRVDSSRQKFGDWDRDFAYLRYFGLYFMDIDRDGYMDIVSGRYFYCNPGGDMTGPWKRPDLGFNVDGMALMDIDGDIYADIIAEALPDIYWLESDDFHGNSWKAVKIGHIPQASHRNGQGYRTANIYPGGKDEIMLAASGGIYIAEIPDDPMLANWSWQRIIETASDEGFCAGDIDGDGNLDIAAGFMEEGENEHPRLLYWWANPGLKKEKWKKYFIDTTFHDIDRIRIADINGDGTQDVVVSEERYPGKNPDAHLYWFENSATPSGRKWRRHILVQQYSMNNLDVGDIDHDGDPDIVTNEHKGPLHRLQIWENNGEGSFTVHEVDRGKECHLGAQFADLDSDGDLDIIGHAWDHYRFLHVWRNDAVGQNFRWKHLSSKTGSLEPPTKTGNQQTASLVADLDKNAINDFVITDRSATPSVVWYRRTKKGWDRFIVDNTMLDIEAGSAFYDIDGDGDPDIVFGGDAKSNQIWWWENPYPEYQKNIPWKRYLIKNSGANKYPDQLFGDFDDDDKVELVFWNQGVNALMLAEIPENPKNVKEWPYHPIFKYSGDSEMQLAPMVSYPGWQTNNSHEGLAFADVDGDGLKDIIKGGLWFKHMGKGKFFPNTIEGGFHFSRTIAGDFIEGGRPEIVLASGDGIGPMYLYQWQGKGRWDRTLLLDKVDNGHTLEALDFNGDGHLDIFNGEMRLNDSNSDSKIRIMLGNGKGGFVHHIVAQGIGIHEGKIADLDGDGDYDILCKSYSWDASRIDIFIVE